MKNKKLIIRELQESDIEIMVMDFAKVNWPKPAAIFTKYLEEQVLGERLVWVVYCGGKFAGYITLKWQSQYEPFYKNNIPEIMDLNVLPDYRNCGIGSRLLDLAEQAASRNNAIVGIGVGLYKDYGAAQKLYVKRGYMPDGNGVTYKYKMIIPGSQVDLDDELVLWFVKDNTNV